MRPRAKSCGTASFANVREQGDRGADAEIPESGGHARAWISASPVHALTDRESLAWKVLIQVMPEKDAAKCPYDPFDLTKVSFHKDYPLIEMGVIELNKNPENYFAEVEQ